MKIRKSQCYFQKNKVNITCVLVKSINTFLTSIKRSSRHRNAWPLPSPGSPSMISDVWILNPFYFEGIVKTTVFKAAIFRQPARTIRTNSGGIRSPAEIFKIKALTLGLKYCKDYFAQGWSPLNFIKDRRSCDRPTD